MASLPIIGLNCDIFDDDHGDITGVRPAYWQAIERAGGLPVLIPHLTTRAGLERVLEKVDGVVLVGGDDISAARLSRLVGREVKQSPHSDIMSDLRENADFLLLQLLLERKQTYDMPVLGVCLANQEVAAIHGSELHQHLPDELPGISHIFDKTEGKPAYHPVRIATASLLEKIWEGVPEAKVNSTHHQGVKKLGSGLRPVAWSPDGLVEALEVDGHKFFLTVQWHPERMTDDELQKKLFDALVKAARGESL